MKIRANNKIVAVIICMSILLTIFSATGFALLYGDHECNGVHCTVCEHLNSLANIAKELGDGVGLFLAILLITTIFLKGLPKFFGENLSVVSLISLKVRMNN